MTLFLSWANIFWAATACIVALLTMQGMAWSMTRWRILKAIIAAAYAVGITLDVLVLDEGQWRLVSRWLGLISWPLVWIIPDLAARRARDRIVTHIDTIAQQAISGDGTTA